MKLFIYDWSSAINNDLYRAMLKQGIQTEIFAPDVSPRIGTQRKAFYLKLEEILDKKAYDALFSVNFFDELAIAAHERGIPYICWSYDSPALVNLSKTDSLFLDTNRLFLFDSYEVEVYKKQQVPNLYYLPLAADTDRLDQMKPTAAQQVQYQSDVSMVGTLYQSGMDEIFPLLDEYGAGYIAAAVNAQLNTYGVYFMEDFVDENLIHKICNKEASQALLTKMNRTILNGAKELDSDCLQMYLARAVTNKERILLLTLLAKYFRVKLFGPDRAEFQNVKEFGPVDYGTEMPLVFKCSKINLNITLRTIRSGIPLRVIDILGCRGLALTNYQEDLFEYFEDGRDLLVYSSMEEALDKCRYYLSHESEAEKIRQNGYKIVRDGFSYENRLNKIWELSGLKSRL